MAISLNARTASQSESFAAIANAGSTPMLRLKLSDSACCAIFAAAIICPVAYKLVKLDCNNFGWVLAIAKDSV